MMLKLFYVIRMKIKTMENCVKNQTLMECTV